MEKALHDLFARKYGAPVDDITALKGDGSGRSVYRLTGAGRKVVGVIGPDKLENAAFLSFSRQLRAKGLSVPEIYAEDLENGVYLEEDLGDTQLFEFLSARRGKAGLPRDVTLAYEQVVSELPRFQITAGRDFDYSACYPRASFDEQSMMWDLNYFKYYFLRLAKIPFSEQALEDDFVALTKFLLEARRDFFLYRDFQSRNIMLKDGKPWFIDYQGGRTGALQYDIASLLYDAKADLPFAFRDRLLERYIEEASVLTPIDRKTFMGHFHGYVFIRIMQAMGAYGLRGFYERKAHFLQSIPYAIRNLEHLLRTAELPVKLPALMGVYKHMVGSSALRQFGGASLKLTVRISSFSFKNGMPADDKGHGGGYVFDCRSLPNPGRFVKYAQQTGRDREVIEYLEKEPAVGAFLAHVYGLVEPAVENYRGRNFTDLMVAFGCTGGRHRSVYCAELLAQRLREKFQVAVELSHREQPA